LRYDVRYRREAYCGGGKTWWCCSLTAALVVLALHGSSLAREGKSPEAERKPAANRATTAEAHYELGVSYHERMKIGTDTIIVMIRGARGYDRACYGLPESLHPATRIM